MDGFTVCGFDMMGFAVVIVCVGLVMIDCYVLCLDLGLLVSG